jgi:hypothetical protein
MLLEWRRMTKIEQTRLVAWRLKIVQRAGAEPRNVAKTCRHFGIPQGLLQAEAALSGARRRGPG